VSFNCSDARLTFGLFVCGQRWDSDLICPGVTAKVFYAAAIVSHHRYVERIRYNAVAEDDVPVVAAGLLDLGPIASAFETVHCKRIVIRLALFSAFQKPAPLDLPGDRLRVCRRRNA